MAVGQACKEEEEEEEEEAVEEKERQNNQGNQQRSTDVTHVARDAATDTRISNTPGQY